MKIIDGGRVGQGGWEWPDITGNVDRDEGVIDGTMAGGINLNGERYFIGKWKFMCIYIFAVIHMY